MIFQDLQPVKELQFSGENYYKMMIRRICGFMKHPVLDRLLITGFLGILLLMAGCIPPASHESGNLKGVITIGPLCPVEKNPPDTGCLPTVETYKAYPVGIWTSKGTIRVAPVTPAPDGSYTIGLDPGNYQLKLEKELAVGGSNLPASVTIISGETTLLNINIDTGIR